VRKAAEIASAFAPREALEGKTSFFLVGIGGAGMSALARMLAHRGFRVRGTDSTVSPETDRLQAEGIGVHIGHTGEGIEASDAVVLTDAIDLGSSPEVARAHELRAPIFRRSQALGWLLKPYKVIAVTGTHGKTTTTSMVGAGLKEAGLDPLIVVGANVPDFGGPVVEGEGEWAVVEACEAYDSFHDFDPHLVVLTNLELDHVDFHGTYANLRDSVVRFVNKVGPTGALIYCEEDSGAAEVANLASVEAIPYRAELFKAYLAMDENFLMGGLRTQGAHNLLNASGAAVAAEKAGAKGGLAAKGIALFSGAERRQQHLMRGRIAVVDDYAHHPTEVRASIQAMRVVQEPFEFPLDAKNGPPKKRVIVVFQPHLYSRTADLIPEFAAALSEADVVFITDIYPAREAPIPGVSSARIAELITKPCYYVPSRHLLPMKVADFVREGDVVVGMGAGNIAEFAPAFIKEWDRRRATGDRGGGEIAVLFGGDSSEREISILSGREILASLTRQGFKARLVDVTDLLLSKGDLSQFIGPGRPDLAFLALHGTHAEDGAIQGLLELLHIPYTGSGIQASALAMDKRLTKEILSKNGIRVAEGRFVTSTDEEIDLRPPLVVKPNAEGSTVGLSFVDTDEELRPAIERALTYGTGVLVEEFLKGMEISTPVLGDRALLPVEIAPVSGRYDFASKYTPGATEEIVPARLPESVLKQAQELALKAHTLLGCEGATRTDMIVRGDELFVLEVNTLPGMTQTSLLPNSAKAAGMEFDALVRWLLTDALRRHEAKA